MAGYVKIWTTLANKPEFMSCTALYRGLYLQVIFWCKVLGDTGVISGQSWAGIGSLLGCDGKTARKFLRKFQEFSFLRYTETEYGAIIIEIPKYKYWQQLEVKELIQKIREISEKIPPFTRPDLPDLPDHLADKPPKVIKTDSEHHKAIAYFCDLYEKQYGIKYHFTAGKDATLIKGLLRTFGFDFYCRLVDQLYVTQDEFIVSKGKVTVGVLSACANKLTQEIVNRDDVRSLFTEKERQSILNIARGLGIDHHPLELKHGQ